MQGAPVLVHYVLVLDHDEMAAAPRGMSTVWTRAHVVDAAVPQEGGDEGGSAVVYAGVLRPSAKNAAGLQKHGRSLVKTCYLFFHVYSDILNICFLSVALAVL